MRTDGVKGKLRVKDHYAYADHVIAMWYDSEENNIFLMFHMVIWLGRSDNEKDRWDGVSDSLLQELQVAPSLTPFRMPVKSQVQGRCAETGWPTTKLFSCRGLEGF
jgi:hypothetical protein